MEFDRNVPMSVKMGVNGARRPYLRCLHEYSIVWRNVETVMKRLFLTLLSMTVAGSALAQDSSVPISDFSISNLQNNQTLHVRQSHQGCFGGGTSRIQINQRRVKYFEPVGNQGWQGYPEYKMTNLQVEQLDRHLYWLQKEGMEGGCTTHQSYELEIRENDETIKSGTFSHNWCGFYSTTRTEGTPIIRGSKDTIGFSDLTYSIKETSEPFPVEDFNSKDIISDIQNLMQDMDVAGARVSIGN